MRISRDVERKIFTVTVSQAAPAAGFTGSLVNVLQGTDLPNRVGRYITAKYFDVSWNAYEYTALSADTVRFSVWNDRCAAAGAPTFSQIYDTGTFNAAVALPNVSQYGDRFTCLWDHNVGVSINGPEVVTGKVRIPIPPRFQRIEFLGASTAYPVTNGFIFAIGSALGGSVAIQFNVQLGFTDE